MHRQQFATSHTIELDGKAIEMSPEEMEKWCKHYTEEYDSDLPPLWQATYDNNVPAMKALHYFYKKEVDGFGAANREDSTMPTHICCLRGHVEARASARACAIATRPLCTRDHWSRRA